MFWLQALLDDVAEVAKNEALVTRAAEAYNIPAGSVSLQSST